MGNRMFTITQKWISQTREKDFQVREIKIMLAAQACGIGVGSHNKKGGKGEGNIRNANVTNGEEPTWENEEQQEQKEYQEGWEERRMFISQGARMSPPK